MKPTFAAVRALNEALAGLSAGDREGAAAAVDRLADQLERVARERGSTYLWCEGGQLTVDGEPLSEEVPPTPLSEMLERCGLCGVELPAPAPSRLLSLWVAALAEGNETRVASAFEDVGLRGLRPEHSDTDLDALAAQLGATPTPERGTPAPQLVEVMQPPPPEPTPTLEETGDGRAVLTALVEASDRFEHLVAATRANRVGDPHLSALEQAADRLDELGSRWPVLAVRVHRIRGRGKLAVGPDALHAAGTALLTAALAACLDTPAGSRQRLVRAALFAHLPSTIGARPPSPAPLADGEARRLVEAIRSRIHRRDAPWLELAWVVALEHRLGLAYESGAPTHSAARLVGVVAGFDALSCRSATCLGLSHAQALTTLARNATDTFDPHFVTVLTTLVAASRA